MKIIYDYDDNFDNNASIIDKILTSWNKILLFIKNKKADRAFFTLYAGKIHIQLTECAHGIITPAHLTDPLLMGFYRANGSLYYAWCEREDVGSVGAYMSITSFMLPMNYSNDGLECSDITPDLLSEMVRCSKQYSQDYKDGLID